MLRTLLCSFLILLILALIGARLLLPRQVEMGMNTVKNHAPWPVSDAAQQLHQQLLVADWHADSLLWDRNLLQRSDYGQVDFPRLHEGNVAFQVFTAVTKSPSGQNYHANSHDAADNITPLVIAQTWPVASWSSLFERALYQVQRLQDYAREAPDQVQIILSADDLRKVLNARQASAHQNKANGPVGALMGMEGGHPLEGKIENLEALYAAGYRLIGLQHFFDNELGGSLHGTSNAGLTAFGREVVRKAAEKHMIIDLAHSSPQVVNDVLAITSQPLVVSHSGIFSHCRVKRNFPDTLMQKIAATGGVIGIGYWKDVTCDDTPAGIVKTIRSAIELLGEDHVALGSDFDGAVATQFDTSELAALTHEMLQQGFSETEIRKVMGENMLRVMQQILP
ncbi:MAG: dipeptidase [Saccharospirillaceae bacterium]|nr:dipeptidase [Saccharospirillaceae bacterium]MCD8530206.1 dipeptidase [Saccharospirillaceae bacterium]